MFGKIKLICKRKQSKYSAMMYDQVTWFHLPTTALLKDSHGTWEWPPGKTILYQTSISKFQPLVLHGVTWLVLHKEWGKETSNRSFPNRGVILYRFHQPAALLLPSVVSAAQQDMDTRILERRQRAAGARNDFKDEDEVLFWWKDRIVLMISWMDDAFTVLHWDVMWRL